MIIVEIIPKYSLVVVDLLTTFGHVNFTSNQVVILYPVIPKRIYTYNMPHC